MWKAFRNAGSGRRMRGQVSAAFCWRRTSTFIWTDGGLMERPITRRGALRAAACGFGYLGLADLLAAAESNSSDPLAPKKPHFTPKAKRVIFLFMHGGVSHIDSFDPKERLYRDNGN